HALIKLDLSSDSLSNIPTGRMSTQRLPSLSDPEHGNPTAVERELEQLARDTGSVGIQSGIAGLQIGWGDGAVAEDRRPRYGQISLHSAGVDGLGVQLDPIVSLDAKNKDSGGPMMRESQAGQLVNYGTAYDSVSAASFIHYRRDSGYPVLSYIDPLHIAE